MALGTKECLLAVCGGAQVPGEAQGSGEGAGGAEAAQ